MRPVIEAWRKLSKDSSPDALMFPTFGHGERKGQAVPRWGKNFLPWRIRPVARKLGIPDRLVTFQVMRRTLGTDMQQSFRFRDGTCRKRGEINRLLRSKLSDVTS